MKAIGICLIVAAVALMIVFIVGVIVNSTNSEEPTLYEQKARGTKKDES